MAPDRKARSNPQMPLSHETGRGTTRLGQSPIAVAVRHCLLLASIAAIANPCIASAQEVDDKDRKQDATTLDAVKVEGQNIKIGENRNLDIQRSENDPLPYYIYDQDEISTSGATNVEEFLKNRLTMNTQGLTYSQKESQMGNSSQIDLRGLGTDKTLILINGRRMSGPTLYGSSYQPDVNSIPASMIERIEVLPSSASGIYGGGAIGGVVNIIMKKDYVGNELKVSYENSLDTDSYTRTIALSSGRSFNDGKTTISWSAQKQDGSELLYRDRLKVTDKYFKRVQSNSPTYPVVGTSSNIASSDGSDLVLDNGVSLGSSITHIDPGTSVDTALSDLYSMLINNAGSYNTDSPNTIQSYGGLNRVLRQPPKNESFMGSVRHSFSDSLQGYVDFMYAKNSGRTRVTQFYWDEYVPASSPANPFNQDVTVRWPNAVAPEEISTVINRSLSAGLTAKLPGSWQAMLDFTRASSFYSNFWGAGDWTALGNALADGSYNPFIDTLSYPQNFERFIQWVYPPKTKSHLSDISLRATGPLFKFPWGNTATLTAGLTYRSEGFDSATGHSDYATTNDDDNDYVFYGKSQSASSIYLESLIPFVTPDNNISFVNSLDLQLAVRAEKYKVDTGTSYRTCYYNRVPIDCVFNPDIGYYYSDKTEYSATSPTIAIKYEPFRGVTFRASYSEAFLPPTFEQLLPNDQPESTPTTIQDPANGNTYDVTIVSGGNPELSPLNAKSWNYGLIWQPGDGPDGIRLAVEKYRIVQEDIIDSLSAQSILQMEDRYPDRVTRDPETGLVTLIDTSSMNLTKYETKGWDVSFDWNKTLALGNLSLNMVGTYIQSEKRQFTVDGVSADYAGYVNEGGPIKFKANLNIGFERNNWSVMWSSRYYDSYHQAYSSGSPYYIQYPTASSYTYYTDAQGGDKISSQTYHDVMFTYKPLGSGPESDLTLQVGIKNVFDKIPPFDAYNGYGWYSAYGDIRLRTYYLSLQKRF